VGERLGLIDTWLPRLVRMATDAMYLAGAPPVRYYLYEYYKAEDAALLRHLLLRELDRDGNGMLDASEQAGAKAVGLDVAQLDVPVSHTDLDQLAAAARALDLVPGSYSADSVRYRAFYAAEARASEINAEWRRRVDAAFAESCAWPDYTKWATWKRGIIFFLGGVLGVASLLALGPWLLFWFLAALAGAAQLRRRRLVGFAIGAAGLGMMFGVSLWQSLVRCRGLYGVTNLEPMWAEVLEALAFVCVGGAAGLWAGGLAGKIQRPRLAACVCAAFGGAVLILWGLSPIREVWPALWLVPYGGNLCIAAGVGLVVAGTVGLVLLRRRHARAADPH